MAAVDSKNTLKKRIYKRRKRKTLNLIVIFTITMAINYFFVNNVYDWADRNMDYAVIISLFFARYSIFLISTGEIVKIENSRLIVLLVGAISALSVISFIRDLFSGQYRLLVEDKLSKEGAIFLIAVIFFFVFLKYLVYEKKRIK